MQGNLYLLYIARTCTDKLVMRSLDGEVKLWDLRGPDRATQTWNIHPTGLSAFDVHPQTGVFAAEVNNHLVSLSRPIYPPFEPGHLQ